MAVNDGNLRVARNGQIVIPVLDNDRDIDGDTLLVQSISLIGAQGTAVIANNMITYDPNGAFDYLNLGQEAIDRFRYTITDGHGGTSTATVTVTVFGASDPPVAMNDLAVTDEDEQVLIDVLANDTDDFGPKIVVSVNTAGLLGSVQISPPNTPNNAVIYSPDGQFNYLEPNQTATEIFTYTVSDGVGFDTATVTVTIRGSNDAPIANIDPNGYFVVRNGSMQANDARDS